MITEREIIELINEVIPSDKNRETACFESDAERLVFDGTKILISTDEFSREDKLSESDPYALGWNIAAGAVSDILATGGIPLYYSHALTVSHSWDRNYIRQLSKGIADVLNEYQMTFAGGDLGMDTHFRCTATVLGKPSLRNISRKGSKSGDRIYLSGKVGAGNFNAALSMFGEEKKLAPLVAKAASRFHLRSKESLLVQRYATSCIDTSDGVFNALTTLSDLNHTGYIVDSIPYIRKGIFAAKLLSLPHELLFLGECGEYELLMTVSPDDEQEFLRECAEQKCCFYRIGEMTNSADEKVLIHKKKNVDLGGFDVRARDFEDSKTYLKALTDWIATWENE